MAYVDLYLIFQVDIVIVFLNNLPIDR